MKYNLKLPSTYKYYKQVKVPDEYYLNGTKVLYPFKRQFVQPVLSSNGTLGGSSFAVAVSSYWSNTGNDGYHVFDNSSNFWHGSCGLPQWFIIYNPNPLNITKMIITGISGGNLKAGIIKGSNDGSNWEDIAPFLNEKVTETYNIDLYNNRRFFKYYQIYITECYYWTNGWGYWPLIGKMTITATEANYDTCIIHQPYLVPATLDDYDFLQEIPKRYNLRLAAKRFSLRRA